MGRSRSWGSRLNSLLRILIRALPGKRNRLEVTSEIPRKGHGRGKEQPRAQDPSSPGEPPHCWASQFSIAKKLLKLLEYMGLKNIYIYIYIFFMKISDIRPQKK